MIVGNMYVCKLVCIRLPYIPITDFEEPLKQFQRASQTTNNYDAVIPTEQVNTSDQQVKQELQVQSPKGETSYASTGVISVAVQCSSNTDNKETQTKKDALLKHSSTQSDAVQLVDGAVQTTMNDCCSVMTQTSELDDKCFSDHQLKDDLAVAQSTIVWQSLMIKILEINANTLHHK